MTFTLGGQACTALGNGQGVFALAFHADSAEYDIRRFHIPGTNGNYVLRNGRSGTRIVAKFRIVNTLSSVQSTFANLKSAWANTAVSITGTDGNYTRCQLEKGGLKIVRDPVAKGDGTNVYMDCEATFVSDA